jgi:hypothetical protein
MFLLQQFGRISFFCGVASWAILAATLAVGALSPSPAPVKRLHVLAVSAVISAVAAVGLGVVGLARGSQRAPAALGLVLAVIFLLLFRGAMPSLFP